MISPYGTILDAKREHPPFDVHELATICRARRGHRPGSHTVRRILAEGPPPPRSHRRFPPDHVVADPTQRRLAIVRPRVEGWNATSIAAYLETGRQTVHAAPKRWAVEFAGTPDKSRAPHRPATKVTLRAMATVKELQENQLLRRYCADRQRLQRRTGLFGDLRPLRARRARGRIITRHPAGAARTTGSGGVSPDARAIPRGAESLPMATTVFSVVGERRRQPHRLLLLGDDGHFYAFATNAAQPTAVRPTGEWQLDPELVETSAVVPSDDDL